MHGRLIAETQSQLKLGPCMNELVEWTRFQRRKEILVLHFEITRALKGKSTRRRTTEDRDMGRKSEELGV